MAGALEGIRILDLSWGIAGPLGVLLLAEQGADVIKVEPPGGDPFRVYDGYKVWTRSRRSVTCDLKSDAGVARFRKLAATADVLVESFRPGVMDRLGVGYDALRAELPVSCTAPCRPTRAGTASRTAPATTRWCRRRRASNGSSRDGDRGRSSCTCRCRAWARSSSCRRASSPRSSPASGRAGASRCRRACCRARSSTRPRSGSTSRRRTPPSTT